jgi:hypothetical protein
MHAKPARLFQPHTLLLMDLALLILPPELVEWNFIGVNLDPTDLLFFAMAAAFMMGRQRSELHAARIPYLGLWVAYGVLRSLAYVHAPISSQYLTDPVRAVYQLYRYCWKPLLYYPLGFLLLRQQARRETALYILVLAAGVAAVRGIEQGYGGANATAFFANKNAFGSFLIIPALLALTRTLSPMRFRRGFYALTALVFLRGLVFASSRGAFVAVCLGAVWLCGGLAIHRPSRKALARFVVCGMLLGMVVLALRPDVFERPNVQHLLSARNPLQVATMQWRLDRWEYFVDKVAAAPWLGTWNAADVDLGEHTNTPHNGYLSIAAISGVPSLVLFVIFAGLVLYRALVRVHHMHDPAQRTFLLGVTAAIVAVLLHNVVDSNVVAPAVGRPLLLLFAWAVAPPLSPPARAVAAAHPAPRH